MHGSVRIALGAACCATLLAVAASPVGAALRSAAEQAQPSGAQIANSPRAGFTYVKLEDGYSVELSRKPGSTPYKSVGAYTEMGNRRHLPVVKVRDQWLGVAPTAKRNGTIAWIPRQAEAASFVRTMYSVHVDLSQRSMELRNGTHRVLRSKVAVGRPGSSTPTGRFAITDKLNGRKLSSYYGCCVLALNGHQPHLPTGWRGGNRLAIHGSNDPSSFGRAASAGCVRAPDRVLRKLMRKLPAGTPVFIRR